MKNFLLIICNALLLLVLSACSGTFSNKQLQVSEFLPRVEKLQYMSDMTSIAFEWESKASYNIDGFYLYRGNEGEPEMKHIATIDDKFQTHFVDKDLQPNTKYFYTMKTFNDSGYISAKGVTIEAKTSERIAAMPFVESIKGLPNKIKLIWRPHPDVRVSSYVVERAKEDGKFKVLAEVKNRLNAEYIDDNLKPNQIFQYRVSAKTFDGVQSQPSQILYATTKALPPKVEYINATTDVARKIVLSWEKREFKDFSHYRVYASISKLLPFTLLAKVRNNRYEDIINEAGESKYYKITAVDKDGLESLMQDTAVLGKTLEAPKAPTITNSFFSEEGVELSWKSNDTRAVKFIIKRYGGSGDMVFREIKGFSYKDNSAVIGQKYSYEVIAVDSNDLESKPSNKANLGR